VGHTRLAFVSKTPGRTQLINLFRMKNGAALVDLPGYGYAQVPLAVRLQWQGLLEHYLTRRSSLVGLVLIMDSRRPLTELDWKMIGWFGATGTPDPLPADQVGQTDPPGADQDPARDPRGPGRFWRHRLRCRCFPA
jgi:ribosome biogenesis GTP-binding protein YsxC/EngB